MTRWNPCCCVEKECAYLFLKRKVLGLDPVFNSPGINIWGQTFKGYTGSDAITGCGEELSDGIFQNSGISLDFEIWSTPKLLSNIPEDTISWTGSPDLEKKNFTYFISGSFVLPKKYQGLSFGSDENVTIKNGGLHYRYFAGNDQILDSIKQCLGIRREDLFSPKIEHVYPGNICDYYLGNQINGITPGITYDYITYGITADDEPNKLSDEHIFDIKVNYSDDLNNILKATNHRIFYSVVKPTPPVEGEITPLCKASPAWCRGLTLYGSCYVPPNNIDDKQIKFAFYQTIPEALELYRVDLHKCTDAETKETYLSIGNVYFEESFRIQPVLPASEKLGKCVSDLSGACEPDTIDAGLSDTAGIICKAGRYLPNNHDVNYDVDLPLREYCEPIDYTKKGLKWNVNCKNFPCIADNPDCVDYEQRLRQEYDSDCSEEINGELSFTVPWLNYTSTEETCTDCSNPDNARRVARTIFTGREIFTIEGAAPFNPDSSTCQYSNSESRQCGGSLNEYVECEQIVYRYSRCNPPEPVNEPNFTLNVLDDNSFLATWVFTNNSSVTTVYCDGTSETTPYTSETRHVEYGSTYNCKKFIEQIRQDNLCDYIDHNFCTCCCGESCNGTTDSQITVASLQDDTQYEINPYIMIDGDPLYFEAPGYTLPNFNNYIKNYLQIWKNDRQELDPSVDNYEVLVDNPKCNTQIAGVSRGPGNIFFLNKEKGITGGIFKKELCKSVGKTLSVPIWDVVPNPDYPCETVYTFASKENINCFGSVKNKSFNYISNQYSKLSEEQQPTCFKQIINYFPTKINNNIIFLDGITLDDCSGFRSVSQVNDILKF